MLVYFVPLKYTSLHTLRTELSPLSSNNFHVLGRLLTYLLTYLLTFLLTYSMEQSPA